jgi:hypothetical protein
MKKQILSIVAVAGFACGAFGQGQVFLDNTANTSVSPTDPNNGVLFQLISGNPVLLDQDVNLTLLGGATAGSLSIMASIYGANAAGDSYGSGLFSDPAGSPYNVPGVSVGGGTGYFQLEAWIGSDTSYAAALLDNSAYAGISTVWSQATGNAIVPSAPNTPAATLTGMPSFVLNPVSSPEPSSLALAGLGGLGMLMAMRRKKA